MLVKNGRYILSIANYILIGILGCLGGGGRWRCGSHCATLNSVTEEEWHVLPMFRLLDIVSKKWCVN